MHRRDLLKAMVAAPLIAGIAGCKPNEEEKHEVLEVYLEGAFALVVRHDQADSLLAFSPRTKSAPLHEFHFNGSLAAYDTSKTRSFTLSLEGRDRRVRPEISPGLKDFVFESEKWRIGDSLVTIDLPAPDQITFYGDRSPVKFSAGRNALMPRNRILRYELRKEQKFHWECDNKPCDVTPDSFPGVHRVFFEIGPQKILNYQQAHAHAIDFFNYILEQSFLDVKDRLLPPYGKGQTPGMAPAVFHPGQHDLQLMPTSYVIDCEAAGPTVGTNSAPTRP